jgi:hypothetical protein
MDERNFIVSGTYTHRSLAQKLDLSILGGRYAWRQQIYA